MDSRNMTGMHILVDGYNLIGRQKGLRGDLELKRKKLISDLSSYSQLKGNPVILIFDGGRMGWESEHQENIGNITVIFSKRGESADQVIIRWAQRLGSACAVVSSDREVQRAVREAHAIPVYSGEFQARLDHTLGSGPMPSEKTEEPDEENPAERKRASIKKGNPFRRSKSERRRKSRIKKL